MKKPIGNLIGLMAIMMAFFVTAKAGREHPVKCTKLTIAAAILLFLAGTSVAKIRDPTACTCSAV